MRDKTLMLLTLWWLGTGTGFAQLISAGAKGGVPLSPFFDFGATGTVYRSHSKRYTVGATVELNLPLGLSVELDALYKRLGYSLSSRGEEGRFHIERTSGNSWEFPLLVKKRLRTGAARPYIGGGPTLGNVSGLRQLGQFFDRRAGAIDTGTPRELKHRTNVGFAAGVGIEFRLPAVRISPEFRYTRWGYENFKLSGFQSNKQQAEFLLGLTF